MQNLVQGSWPAYHPIWRLSKIGDATAKANADVILAAMDAEYELLLSAPSRGLRVIGQRMAQHPWVYASWYLLHKPYELWGWSIEIGQGDIYPYPVTNSPFETNTVWRALAAVCQASNPLLLVFAVAFSPITWWRVRYSRSSLQPGLLGAMGLLAFITLIYSLLQAEPRYSIPFRAFEIALAFTTLATAGGWWNKYRADIHMRRA